MGLNSARERVRAEKRDGEGQEWRWCQIKPTDRLHLDLAFKRLRCINFLITCATFSNQKLWCGTIFLDKNDETKISSDLQFKA